jgi:hypothetical protein
MVHEAPEQLHRHVLEGEGGAVEELEHEQVVTDLGQRADGGVAEGGVGLVNHAPKLGLRDVAADQGPEHGFRSRGIGLAGKAADRFCGQARPAFR